MYVIVVSAGYGPLTYPVLKKEKKCERGPRQCETILVHFEKLIRSFQLKLITSYMLLQAQHFPLSLTTGTDNQRGLQAQPCLALL